MSLSSQALSIIRIGQGMVWSVRIMWLFALPVGKHYKVTISAHCHKSLPVLLWPYMLLGQKTITNLLSFLNSPPSYVIQPWRYKIFGSYRGLRNSFLCDPSQHISEGMHVTDVWSELLMAYSLERGPGSLNTQPPRYFSFYWRRCLVIKNNWEVIIPTELVPDISQKAQHQLWFDNAEVDGRVCSIGGTQISVRTVCHSIPTEHDRSQGIQPSCPWCS